MLRTWTAEVLAGTVIDPSSSAYLLPSLSTIAFLMLRRDTFLPSTKILENSRHCSLVILFPGWCWTVAKTSSAISKIKSMTPEAISMLTRRLWSFSWRLISWYSAFCCSIYTLRSNSLCIDSLLLYSSISLYLTSRFASTWIALDLRS